MTAESVAFAFYNGLIARFVAPIKITTGQSQFESGLFEEFSKLLGYLIILPRMVLLNDRIELFKPQLNATIILTESECYQPYVESAISEDIGASMFEFVYGSVIRLPGKVFSENKDRANVTEFVQVLKGHLKLSDLSKG